MQEAVIIVSMLISGMFAQPELNYPYWEIDLMQLKFLQEYNSKNNETKKDLDKQEKTAPTL